jgi:TPR repeat protein
MFGYCYQAGRGVDRNFEEAMAQYRKATQLGFLLLGEPFEFIKQQLQSKNKTSALSCINSMGYTYAKQNNMSEAIKHFEIASGKGSAAANYNLGHCYENGKGVKKDIELAKKYYEEASKKGYKKAIEAVDRLNF